ncbi:Uncharacterised protein [BD1-7 clade bacterium]|uniref:Uncharacterized protein n=1 Tax=BD1-7 clade bacterium TaxID=2029982 RepID=A0A5S9MUM1_9GAMM|nr:Uncharacterised protein [BD1-7 clade bacterium]
MQGNDARKQQTQLAMHGCIIMFLGLAAGIGFSYAAAVGSNTSQLYGSWKFAHMEGITNGLVVLAVASFWHRINVSAFQVVAARWMLVIGCYCNIIGPIITALFIGHRVIIPLTPLEYLVVYGFYTPGVIPLFAFPVFIYQLYKSAQKIPRIENDR